MDRLRLIESWIAVTQYLKIRDVLSLWCGNVTCIGRIPIVLWKVWQVLCRGVVRQVLILLVFPLGIIMSHCTWQGSLHITGCVEREWVTTRTRQELLQRKLQTEWLRERRKPEPIWIVHWQSTAIKVSHSGTSFIYLLHKFHCGIRFCTCRVKSGAYPDVSKLALQLRFTDFQSCYLGLISVRVSSQIIAHALLADLQLEILEFKPFEFYHVPERGSILEYMYSQVRNRSSQISRVSPLYRTFDFIRFWSFPFFFLCSHSFLLISWTLSSPFGDSWMNTHERCERSFWSSSGLFFRIWNSNVM